MFIAKKKKNKIYYPAVGIRKLLLFHPRVMFIAVKI